MRAAMFSADRFQGDGQRYVEILVTCHAFVMVQQRNPNQERVNALA